MHLPAEMAQAGSYLAAYGDTPGARYRELGDLLADVARGSVMPSHIVAGATEAFRHQRAWFSNTARSEHATHAPFAS